MSVLVSEEPKELLLIYKLNFKGPAEAESPRGLSGGGFSVNDKLSAAWQISSFCLGERKREGNYFVSVSTSLFVNPFKGLLKFI